MMQVDAQVRYFTDEHPWLCFKHAVKLAMEGEDVKTEVDNYYNDCYMGSSLCGVCYPESRW